MNRELRELFEIKQDEEKSIQPTGQNVKKHILIRLAVLIFGSVAFLIAMSQAKGWDVLGYLFLMMIFHAVWLLFIIIEMVILQGSEKLKLRNVNLIFTLVLLLIYGIGSAVVFSGS
ncbi:MULTISPECIES: hypothetical protein [Chryseobacterium]|uniref:Cytochrome C oxidase subunit IV n=1 Tax=Chryseobacterium rhizosphaerae TaxID=395937 RepID=A0ABX9IE33_9FLAO|nr:MULTISPECIES: hypothetical protein [Chryseobacterium]MBL3548978.1 hypothetical protein [Chryseobacterium sp. KMC2]REC70266.1 hypothetical protein DRF57_22340 [Chryseobacterium rhizosphaerae]GEN69671.1 hypothetical protein CRH01_42390 [Chryseobacterium rhizosphaerae]